MGAEVRAICFVLISTPCNINKYQTKTDGPWVFNLLEVCRILRHDQRALRLVSTRVLIDMSCDSYTTLLLDIFESLKLKI